LKLISRGGPHSNSGIFFHTDYSERDKARHLAKGYEVQLNNTDTDVCKTGSLYQIVDLDKSTVDDTRWFEMHIIVQGKQIAVNIDGKKVMDYAEPEHPERPEGRKLRVLDPKAARLPSRPMMPAAHGISRRSRSSGCRTDAFSIKIRHRGGSRILQYSVYR